MIPASWAISTPNAIEIRWMLKDVFTGTQVDAKFCSRAPGTNRTRIDVREVYTFSEIWPIESGFCVSGEIDRGQASAMFNGTFNDFAFQQRCPETNFLNSSSHAKRSQDDLATWRMWTLTLQDGAPKPTRRDLTLQEALNSATTYFLMEKKRSALPNGQRWSAKSTEKPTYMTVCL